MSYYITAHRKGAKINVPVEEKHKYITDKLLATTDGHDVYGYSQEIATEVDYVYNTFNLNSVNFKNYINTDGNSRSTNGIVPGLNVGNPQKPKLFYRPKQLYLTQGTGARERIGDKVFLKKVQIMLNLSLLDSARTLLSGNKNEIVNQIPVIQPVSFETVVTAGVITGGAIQSTSTQYDQYVNHNYRANIKQWYKFRIMLVRFNNLLDEEATNEDDLKNYIQEWFNTIWVPQAIVPASSSGFKDINVVSNQSKMLRESTKYNGKYNILYDQMVELNQNDTSKHIEINLDPKKNLNFDSDLHPTNEDWNNVYGFIIPPLYYKTDIDLVSYQTLQNNGSSVELAEFTTNIKFTFYDI